MEITGAASLTGTNVPDNTQEPLSALSSESYQSQKNEMAPTMENTATNEAQIKQREERKRREERERLIRDSQQKNEQELLTENHFRSAIGQGGGMSALEKAQLLTNRQNASDPTETIEDSKKIIGLIMDGGFSSALEESLTSPGQENEQDSQQQPATAPAQNPMPTFQPNAPRRG